MDRLDNGHNGRTVRYMAPEGGVDIAILTITPEERGVSHADSVRRA
jgi:hypothetical protein